MYLFIFLICINFSVLLDIIVNKTCDLFVIDNMNIKKIINKYVLSNCIQLVILLISIAISIYYSNINWEIIDQPLSLITFVLLIIMLISFIVCFIKKQKKVHNIEIKYNMVLGGRESGTIWFNVLPLIIFVSIEGIRLYFLEWFANDIYHYVFVILIIFCNSLFVYLATIYLKKCNRNNIYKVSIIIILSNLVMMVILYILSLVLF